MKPKQMNKCTFLYCNQLIIGNSVVVQRHYIINQLQIKWRIYLGARFYPPPPQGGVETLNFKHINNITVVVLFCKL